MRLWSIHPQYLDTKGLVALWREGLLAKKVLQGKTKGYKNHPQLVRFKGRGAASLINRYLWHVLEEAHRRGFNFDKTKVRRVQSKEKIQITQGQLEYEFKHLKRKLKQRDYSRFKELMDIDKIIPHPLFSVVKEDMSIESWERK